MPKKHESNDFDVFIKKQREVSANSPKIDWNKERDEWLAFLVTLYKQIEGFLAKYIKSKDITQTYREIPLEEENIGKYTAEEMILKLGNQEIVLTPVGTLLIGMKGRVEAVGPRGQIVFVLVDQKSSGPQIKVTITSQGQEPPKQDPGPKRKTIWTWKILTYTPQLKYIDLTQELLFKALMAIANA